MAPIRKADEEQAAAKAAKEDIKGVRSTGSKKKKKTFLGLPPELRNNIYELALIDGVVHVDKDLKQPGLLQTCRQIRAETIKIWYFQCEFHVPVVHCDARLLGKWTRHVEWREKECRVSQAGACNFKISFGGSPDWENMMAWCLEVHGGKSAGLRVTSEGNALSHTASAALGIAFHCQQTPWPKVQMALEILRHTFGRVDQKWIEGFEGY